MSDSTSSTPGRLMPRVSLLTMFLLLTIAGMAIVIVGMWREIGPLRAQVHSMRTELGLLNVDDPKVAQAIQLGTNEVDHWKWRIYLPPGSAHQLYVYSGTIPPHDPPNDWFDAVRKSASGMSGTIKDGEFVLQVQLVKEGTQWKVVTSRGIGLNRGTLSVAGDWLSEMTGRGVASYVGADQATRFQPGRPIHLMTLLEPVVTRNGNSTSWTTPSGPANGIVVWIE